MSEAVVSNSAPHAGGHGHPDAGEVKVFGFWVYLMTDLILFGSIFATFAVLSSSYAGGPTGKELFDLPYVAVETFALLLSSVTFGFSSLATHRGDKVRTMLWIVVTFILGAEFIGMELNEFHHMIAEGNGPDRSAFLSGFFGLVGTHGLHVTVGLIWMLVMMHQVATRGLTDTNSSRLACLSLFWHFLDIVWVGVFTIVYLMGVL